MPWFRLDIHWYADEAIEAAGEAAGSIALALWPVLIGKAKAEQDKGRARFTYRELSHVLFTTPAEVRKGIEGLVSAGVLTCPQLSDRGGQIAFEPGTWKRWNESARKAAGRGEGGAK